VNAGPVDVIVKIRGRHPTIAANVSDAAAFAPDDRVLHGLISRENFYSPRMVAATSTKPLPPLCLEPSQTGLAYFNESLLRMALIV
jgi:hypothetical protein